MYTIDNRTKEKDEAELLRDKLNIMQAFRDIFGVTTFGYRDERGAPIMTATGNVTEIGSVWLIEDRGGKFKRTFKDIELYKAGYSWRKPKPLGEFSAMGYGEVVYISQEVAGLTRIHVHLKGETLLVVDYNEPVDIWEFSLHYQQALKEHTEDEFHEQLNKDKTFFKK